MISEAEIQSQMHLGKIELDAFTLLSEMPGGFFVYTADKDERLIYVNKACLRIFGCETLEQFDELTGMTFPGMVHPDDLEEIEESIKKQIESDIHKMDYVEYRIITYDGDVRWIEDYGHYAQMESGDYFYVFIDDATDRLNKRMLELKEINHQLNEAYYREHEHRRLLRAALKQANTANIAKTTFLNNMSHDLRTHLNAIMGYSQLISAQAADPEKVLSHNAKIAEASAQLLEIVTETLEVSHFEAGRTQLFEDQCSWSAIIGKLEERFQPLANAKEISLEIDATGIEHDVIFADEQRIRQIMEQLLDNAIKYTGIGGRVSLKIEEGKDSINGYRHFDVTIKDNGIGMSSSFIEHMYDPFERDSTTTESGISGTGLGLTIVKHTIDLLAGRIDVESTPGEGTTIKVGFSAKIDGPEMLAI